jgi:hypothetical protein
MKLCKKFLRSFLSGQQEVEQVEVSLTKIFDETKKKEKKSKKRNESGWHL